MNLDNKKNRKNIIISVGDDSGVGPETILKALFSKDLIKDIDITLVGCKKKLESQYQKFKKIGIKKIADPNQFKINNVSIKEIITSKDNILNGNTTFHYLKAATKLVQKLPNSALVTGPICKKSWELAGHLYSGQTEFLAESCNAKKVGMLFTAKSPYTGWRFNTLLATTHIPLAEIPKRLTKELIINKLELLYSFCIKYNAKPSFKVAGLNPHAGEDGLLGIEEKVWIKKTLEEWKEENLNVSCEGPISPDSCWISSAKAWKEKDSSTHEGILAMYHDQGLIPMKVIALNYSVNMTLGLPFIRTSPDHGTGFDIAGKGIAQCQSMIEAIKTAKEFT